jgi:hypothetical protein
LNGDGGNKSSGFFFFSGTASSSSYGFGFSAFGFSAFGFSAFGFSAFGFSAFGFSAFGCSVFGFSYLGYSCFGYSYFGAYFGAYSFFSDFGNGNATLQILGLPKCYLNYGKSVIVVNHLITEGYCFLLFSSINIMKNGESLPTKTISAIVKCSFTKYVEDLK